LSTEKIINKYFTGNNIKKMRYAFSLTLENLSNQLNINFATFKNYESNIIYPSIQNIKAISDFFNISIDFLILGNDTKYSKNTLFISLAQKIDKLDQVKRFQIENTINTLITENNDSFNKYDPEDIILSENLNENLKILREFKQLSQQSIADYLETKQSVISRYEKKTTPPIDNLVKLSTLFNISINALVTGKILNYSFKNESFKEAVLKADNLLSLEHPKFLIELMENILKS